MLLMLLLLACSAFFSGAETAFFNLSRRQVKLLRESKHRLQHLAASLTIKPGRLLGCLLLGNMVVNVLFFAVASVLTVRIGQEVGVTAAAVSAGVSFVILVLFGETVPKSLAYANSRSVSVTVVLPLYVWLQIAAPIQFVFRFLIVGPALRLILGRPQPPKPISTEEFRSLIDGVRRRGLITADENRLLGEIIELGFLKVRHVMRPRVDVVACSVTDPPQKAREIMQKKHLTKLPVYVRAIDNIVGLVHLRHLLLEGSKPLDKIVQRVHFVPEQKTVESLLEFFRKSGTDTAIAVDEYGGIAGLVRLEDIAEELLGPIESASGIEPIEQLGPLKYRLAGTLAVHDWADAFGIEPDESRVATVGGLVTALLGKIPKSGETACLGNLRFTVEAVCKHRIETVILTLEPISSDDK